MADLKFQAVRHDHKAFLEKASKRQGFSEAYDALEVEYSLAHEMLAARARAGLTQEAVAVRMGTTKSAISRLEAAGKHAPSVLVARSRSNSFPPRPSGEEAPNPLQGTLRDKTAPRGASSN